MAPLSHALPSVCVTVSGSDVLGIIVERPCAETELPPRGFLFCATIMMQPCVESQRSALYGPLPTEQRTAAHPAVPSPRTAYEGHYSCAASAKTNSHEYHLHEAV